jgi:hypothetical protein
MQKNLEGGYYLTLTFQPCPWQRLSNVPSSKGAKRLVRVIHPFHPLKGKSFEFVDHRVNWGEDRVYYRDEDGQVRSILARCTDVYGLDPFVEVAAGRAFFRYDDLMRLADLLEEMS